MKKKTENKQTTTDDKNSKIGKPIPFSEYFGKTGTELKKVMEEYGIPEDEQIIIMEKQGIKIKKTKKKK